MGRQRALVVVHYDSNDGAHDAASRPTLDAIEAALGAIGSRLVYASVETTPMTFLSHLKRNDPNPLEHRETALFAVESGRAAKESVDAHVIRRVHQAAPGAVVQTYERLTPAQLLF